MRPLHAILFLTPLWIRFCVGQSVTDYAPKTDVRCPDSDLVRVFSPDQQSLHPDEVSYIKARESTTVLEAWKSYVGDGSGIGYKISDFNGDFPRVGLAISGGGHRAAQYAAGVISALDARNESSKAAGTGGVLQLVSYLSALSGVYQYLT
jgi:lysophospholipase